MVQKVIRKVFAECTVLTIAHRIVRQTLPLAPCNALAYQGWLTVCLPQHTIADSTRIMVLSDGRVVEYDSPEALMDDTESVYRSLVEESEKARESDDKEG